MNSLTIIDQTRPDQTRPDQTRPDQTRPDQTRPDHPIVRNSSLELLRIAGMLSIVAFHLSLHGGFDFSASAITANMLWYRFMSMGGGLGNCLFVMISGYFLINSSGFRVIKAFSLWARAFFFSVTIFCVFAAFGLADFSRSSLLKAAMPMTTRQWWFVRTYLALYILHPFLNVFLLSMSRRCYQAFLGVAFLVFSVFDWELPTGGGVLRFMYQYSVAAYVRLYCESVRGRKYIFIGIFFIALNYARSIIFPEAGHFLANAKPLTIAASVCLLIGFRSLNVSSRVINKIASATLGVYLLHENQWMSKFLWRDVFRVSSFQDSGYFVPYTVFAVITVYVLCTVAEFARSKVFRTLSGGRLS